MPLPNRRVPNGTHGGVGGRGLATPSYPIFGEGGPQAQPGLAALLQSAGLTGKGAAGEDGREGASSLEARFPLPAMNGRAPLISWGQRDWRMPSMPQWKPVA